MKLKARLIVLVCVSAALVWSTTSCQENGKGSTSNTGEVIAFEQWVTSGDRTFLLKKVDTQTSETDLADLPVIEVDTQQKFQSIDGFGYSLTGGSAYLLHQLPHDQRSKLLQELFGMDDHAIGVSYLRISLGASDLNPHVFSYADEAKGNAHKTLETFSLSEDKKYLIPVLKEILAIAPDIKIMASPWSAPAWMKTNNSFKGGSLDPKYYSVYADYFVKYIQGMKQEGIVIDAITVQNEPENPNNNPSMVMTAPEQADFVKNHLGPAFEKSGITTKIIVFDHNCDHPEYPITVLNDAAAKKHIDGTAFHLYLGEIEALSTVHNAHPDKSIYFTEQWTSPEGTFDGDLLWHTRHLIIGATRNWSRNVLEWNLAADQEYNPHTDDGGCTACMGALTIGDSISRNVSYYIIAHASKFVKPGSIRVASTIPQDLHNVSFVNSSGKNVMIVVNENTSGKKFAVTCDDKIFVASLPAQSVGTFAWQGGGN